MARLRLFATGDIKTLIDTWNGSLEEDPLNEQRFISEIIGDPAMERLGFPVVEDDDGNVIAFAYATVSPGGIGWINAIGVHPGQRRKGYGTQCMRAVEDYFASNRCRIARVAAFAPKYIVPGVDAAVYPAGLAFFRHMGFAERDHVVSMQADLRTFHRPLQIIGHESRLASDGVMFEPLSGEHVLSLLEFIRDDLASSAYQVIRQALAMGRNMQQIFIAREGPHIIGYCMYGIYDGNLERFGPFGVRIDQRGRHVGTVLLYCCLQAMKAQGLSTVWFKSTTEHSPAWHLYRQAGFNNVRRFTTLYRSL